MQCLLKVFEKKKWNKYRKKNNWFFGKKSKCQIGRYYRFGKDKKNFKRTILFKTEHLKTILLYGFPGCGKILLEKAAGSEPGVNLIRISSSDLMNSTMIKNEKVMKELFDLARKNMPCIILFD